jgi:hypothetical protein
LVLTIRSLLRNRDCIDWGIVERVESVADWEEVDRRGIGPFTTSVVLRSPDGRQVEYTAWNHRKGHGLIDVAHAKPRASIRWWAPDRRGWWIAILFMIGAACFALGAFPPTTMALGSAAAWVFFIGSIFFTSAAYLQYFEATNEGDDIEGLERGRRFIGARTQSIGWWAAVIQLLGTVAFNVSTFNALRDLSTWQEETLVWVPDVVGSICFLVASALVILETHDRIRGMLFRSLESRISAINMLGSIAFGISAIGAFVVPSTGDLLSVTIVNIFTFLGAVLFFIGALLLIPDISPKPRQLVPTTGE